MFQSISELFSKHDIPLDNCLAIAVDNTNANVGCRNSLKTRLTAANPSIYTSGCVCHMIHNAAGRGAAQLQVCLIGVQPNVKYGILLCSVIILTN